VQAPHRAAAERRRHRTVLNHRFTHDRFPPS
jgi:hypothetical protein